MRGCWAWVVVFAMGCGGSETGGHGVLATGTVDDSGVATGGGGADGGSTGTGTTTSTPTGDDSGPPDPFAGAPAFAPPARPALSVLPKHLAEGAGNITGQDCMTCHDGSTDLPVFLFGGTVYTDSTGTKGAANVEVRVIDSAKAAHVVYSDVDGNFYEYATGGAFAFPGHPGVRNAAGSYAMVSDMASAGCNASKCHSGTSKTYKRIYAP